MKSFWKSGSALQLKTAAERSLHFGLLFDEAGLQMEVGLALLVCDRLGIDGNPLFLELFCQTYRHTMNDSITEFPTLSFEPVHAQLLSREEIALIDVREEDPFAQGHPLWAANLPLLRLELNAWRRIPRRDTLIVLYGVHDGVDLAPCAAAVFAGLGYSNVQLLEGGLYGWSVSGGELFRDVNIPGKAFGALVEHERHKPSLPAELATPITDRYRRPYEGTDASAEAMQAYLDWEFGLVVQLPRDGPHHFQVL